MQNIVIAKPYRFVPPRFSPFWARIIQWYLPTYLRKSFGITSWECVGAERLLASLNAGSGVLLASNHCRPCDPMVLGLLAREVARPFHVMASWHLFMQNRVQSFLLPRIGGFSVYREGLDRESLKCATRILAEAQFPLTIFPEGFVTRNNDRLLHLMDGVAFLARSAAKQRAASPQPGKVVVHPVFVRYFFRRRPRCDHHAGLAGNRSPPVLAAAESSALARTDRQGRTRFARAQGNRIPRRVPIRRSEGTAPASARSSAGTARAGVDWRDAVSPIR